METQWPKNFSRQGFPEIIQQELNVLEQLVQIMVTLSEWTLEIISILSLQPTKATVHMII